MGCNSAKLQSERAGFVSHTSDFVDWTGHSKRVALHQKKKKRGRETGWSQAASESIMVTENCKFPCGDVLANSLRQAGSNVFSVSASAGRSM